APTPALANDTGASGTDGITNDATVNVTGIVAGATWEYSTNGGTTWSPGSGTSFELAPNLLYAANAIQVRQTNTAGLTSEAGSHAGTINVDIASPTPQITDNTSGTASGPVTFSFNFVEAVTGFDASDITV